MNDKLKGKIEDEYVEAPLKPLNRKGSKLRDDSDFKQPVSFEKSNDLLETKVDTKPLKGITKESIQDYKDRKQKAKREKKDLPAAMYNTVTRKIAGKEVEIKIPLKPEFQVPDDPIQLQNDIDISNHLFSNKVNHGNQLYENHRKSDIRAKAIKRGETPPPVPKVRTTKQQWMHQMAKEFRRVALAEAEAEKLPKAIKSKKVEHRSMVLAQLEARTQKKEEKRLAKHARRDARKDLEKWGPAPLELPSNLDDKKDFFEFEADFGVDEHNPQTCHLEDCLACSLLLAMHDVTLCELDLQECKLCGQKVFIDGDPPDIVDRCLDERCANCVLNREFNTNKPTVLGCLPRHCEHGVCVFEIRRRDCQRRGIIDVCMWPYCELCDNVPNRFTPRGCLYFHCEHQECLEHLEQYIRGDGSIDYTYEMECFDDFDCKWDTKCPALNQNNVQAYEIKCDHPTSEVCLVCLKQKRQHSFACLCKECRARRMTMFEGKFPVNRAKSIMSDCVGGIKTAWTNGIDALKPLIANNFADLFEKFNAIIDVEIIHTLECIIFYLHQMYNASSMFDAYGKTLMFAKAILGDSIVLTNGLAALVSSAYGIISYLRSTGKETEYFETEAWSEPINDVLEFLKQGVESTFMNSIKKIVVSIFAFKIFDKTTAISTFKWLGEPESDNVFGHLMTLMQGIKTLVDASQLMWHGASFSEAFLDKNPYQKAITTAQELLQFKDRLYSGMPSPGGMHRKEFIHKADKTLQFLKAYKNVSVEIKKEAKDQNGVVWALEQAMVVAMRFELSKQRIMPFGIVAHGSPSIGKSSVVVLIYKIFCAVMDVDYNPDMVYDRVVSSEYWSGYDTFQHWIIHYSEIGNINQNLVKMKGDDAALELVSVLDRLPMIPNMAAVEDKGKHRVTPYLVVSDTNNVDQNFSVIAQVPGAYHRRFWRVSVIVKDDNRKPGTTALDPTVITDKYYDKWHFILERPVMNDNVCTFVPVMQGNPEDTVDKFIAVLGEAMKRHFELEESLIVMSEREKDLTNYDVNLDSIKAKPFDREFAQKLRVYQQDNVAWELKAKQEEHKEDVYKQLASGPVFNIDVGKKRQSRFKNFVNNLLPFASECIVSGPDDPIYKNFEEKQDLIHDPQCLGCALCTVDGPLPIKEESKIIAQLKDYWSTAVTVADLSVKIFKECMVFAYFELGDRVGPLVRAFSWTKTLLIFMSVLYFTWGAGIFSSLFVASAVSFPFSRVTLDRHTKGVEPNKEKKKRSLMSSIMVNLRFAKTLLGFVVPIPESGLWLSVSLGAALAALGVIGVVTKLTAKKRRMVHEEIIWMESTAIVVEHASDPALAEVEEKSGTARPVQRVQSARGSHWFNAFETHNDAPDPVHIRDINEAWPKLRRNLYFVEVAVVKDKVVKYVKVHMFGQRGSWAYLPLHALSGEKKGIIKRFLPNHTEENPSYVLTQFDESNIRVVGPDLVLIRLSGTQFHDITKHLYTNSVYNAKGWIDGTEVVLSRSVEELKNMNTGDIVPSSGYKYDWHDHSRGKCGIPVFAFVANTWVIIGFHAGGKGSQSTKSFAVEVPKDIYMCESAMMEISNLPDKDFTGVEPHRKSPMRYEHVVGVEWLGSDPEFHADHDKSRLKKTGFDGTQLVNDAFGTELKDEWRKPCFNAHPTGDGEWISPWNYNIKKFSKNSKALNPTTVKYVVESFTEHIDDGRKCSPWDLEVAVNGAVEDVFIRRMNAATSAGKGTPGLKSKYIPVVEGVKRELLGEYREKLVSMINEYASGKTCAVIWGTFLKDEPRALAKVLKGATRLIYGIPLLYYIASRMYLGPVYADMLERSDVYGSAIGIDMHREADKLYHEMNDFCDRDPSDGDYGSFDVSMIFDVSHAAASVIYNRCVQFGYNDFALKVVQGILTEMLFPRFHIYGEVFIAAGKQPSGALGTAEFNCIKNRILLMYAYFTETKTLNDGNLVPKTQYYQEVKDKTYGDDVFWKTKLDWFNAVWFSHFCDEHYGMEFTSAAKDGVLRPSMPIDDIVFLQRKFVEHPELKMRTGALGLDRIARSLTWMIPSRVIPSEIDQVADTIRSASRELYLHGNRVAYDKMRDSIMTQFKELYGVECNTFPSYDHYTCVFMAEDLQPYNGQVPMEEQKVTDVSAEDVAGFIMECRHCTRTSTGPGINRGVPLLEADGFGLSEFILRNRYEEFNNTRYNQRLDKGTRPSYRRVKANWRSDERSPSPPY